MADDANRSVVNEKTYTFKESFSAFAEIPGKLGNHISLEIEKTKEFQKKNWADMKAQISTLISKFSKNND